MDNQSTESFKRVEAEIRNRTLAETYLKMIDKIGQNEFARRMGLEKGRFSAILKNYKTKTQ